jgi:hypothetical protein
MHQAFFLSSLMKTTHNVLHVCKDKHAITNFPFYEVGKYNNYIFYGIMEESATT